MLYKESMNIDLQARYHHVIPTAMFNFAASTI